MLEEFFTSFIQNSCLKFRNFHNEKFRIQKESTACRYGKSLS